MKREVVGVGHRDRDRLALMPFSCALYRLMMLRLKNKNKQWEIVMFANKLAKMLFKHEFI